MVRVGARYRPFGIATQFEYRGVRPENEPPGLGVVHGRRRDGVFDEGNDALGVQALC